MFIADSGEYLQVKLNPQNIQYADRECSLLKKHAFAALAFIEDRRWKEEVF